MFVLSILNQKGRRVLTAGPAGTEHEARGRGGARRGAAQPPAFGRLKGASNSPEYGRLWFFLPGAREQVNITALSSTEVTSAGSAGAEPSTTPRCRR